MALNDLSPFLQDVADQEWHDLYNEVITLNTMVAGDFEPTAVDAQAAATYRLNPDVAVFAMLGCAANRMAMLVGAQEQAGGRPNTVQVSWSRLVAASTSPLGGAAPAEECLIALELVAHDQLVPADITRLVRNGGQWTFTTLFRITHELGLMLVEQDPKVRTLADLVANEGMQSMQSWIEVQD